LNWPGLRAVKEKIPTRWQFLVNLPIVFTLTSTVLGGPISLGRCVAVLVDYWLEFQSLIWIPLERVLSVYFPDFKLDDVARSLLTFFLFFAVANFRTLGRKQVNGYEAAGGVFLAFAVGMVFLLPKQPLVAVILSVPGFVLIAVSFMSHRTVSVTRARTIILKVGVFGFFLCWALLSIAFTTPFNLMVWAVTFIAVFVLTAVFFIINLYITDTRRELFYSLLIMYLTVIALTFVLYVGSYVYLYFFPEAKFVGLAMAPFRRFAYLEIFSIVMLTFVSGLVLLIPVYISALAAINARVLGMIIVTVCFFVGTNYLVVTLEEKQVLRRDVCQICLSGCDGS
jgi:hypothetical protein